MLRPEEDGSHIVEGPERVTSVFSPAETESDTLYKIARVSVKSEMNTTALMSDLPDRYSIARPYGASLDTYGSRYPGEVSESLSDLITWYVPLRHPETLALIHVLENLWVSAPAKPGPALMDRPENTADELLIEATQFYQHEKSFLSFNASVADLLKFVEVIPNREEHKDYPQREIDLKD